MSMELSSWLLFIYQLPTLPSTHRAYAWRKLKALGALYLQNSICVLPSVEDLRLKLQALRAEIAERGGAAQLFNIEWPDASEEKTIVSKIRSQVDDEYNEFLGECDEFHEELKGEREKAHFTFGEFEENEGELQKLRTWLPKIRSRDYFEASLHDRAIAALEACEKDFAVFEEEVQRNAEENSGV